MEMASVCLKQENQPIPSRPVRGPHGGWKKQEIELLEKRISDAAQSGESLRSVFDQIAKELGRKPNSIRNFYYAQIRTQEHDNQGHTLPFETFSPGEVEKLVADVLCARAQGLSVRACVRQLAGGDRTRMLRYQNKYRSVIRTRPQLVHRIMNQLAAQGIAFVSPYTADTILQENTLARLKDRAAQTGDPKLNQFFSSLDYLMELAFKPKPADPSDLADSETQRKADRLSAQCDMLRIALDDEQTRRKNLCTQTESMVTLIKEYIALPDPDKVSACDAFCRQAASCLSAVECAMMYDDTP